MIRHHELKQKLKEVEETYGDLDEENGGTLDRSKVEFWRNLNSRNEKKEENNDDDDDDDDEFDPIARVQELKAEKEKVHQQQPQHVDLASRDHVNRMTGNGSKMNNNVLFTTSRREPLSSSRNRTSASDLLQFQHENHLHNDSYAPVAPFPTNTMGRDHLYAKMASPPKGGNQSKSNSIAGTNKFVHFLPTYKDNEDTNRQTYNNNLNYTSSALAYKGGLRDSKNYSKLAEMQNSIFTIKAKKKMKEQKKSLELQGDASIHATPPAPVVFTQTGESNQSFWSISSFFGLGTNAVDDVDENQVKDFGL